jgi:hypothetical protein
MSPVSYNVTLQWAGKACRSQTIAEWAHLKVIQNFFTFVKRFIAPYPGPHAKAEAIVRFEIPFE